MGENMYCGIGKIPTNKVRGTPEYCVQTNQVRYYGLELIDEDLIKKSKGKNSNLVEEQLKLKKIEERAIGLINEVKKIKIILESDNATNAQKKAAKKN